MPALGRTAQRRLGIGLMAVAMVASASLAGLAAAGAQEAPEEPESTQEAEITRGAYYYAPRAQLLPNTLVSEFPPGVVCIVQPDLCHEDLEPVFSPVEDGMAAVTDGEKENQPEGAGLVAPDTFPVSATGGKPDYRSAFEFELPSVADGEQVESLVIYLTEVSPTYSESSPAFRQAVLAAMTCARECDQDQFDKISETQPVEQDLLDVEMCPIAEDPGTENRDASWEEGDAQKAEKIPDVDCLYGANGQPIPDSDLWAFDLTFAAAAWNDGSLENRGVLIRPANLPNLAFGDPDSSYNKMVSFANTVQYEVAAASEPDPAPSIGGDSSPQGSSASGSVGDSTDSGGFASSPSGGTSGDVFSPPSNQSSDEAAAAPEVAEPAPAPPADDAQQPQTPAVAAGASDVATTPWWMWLLVPIFLGGMYLTTQSLTAPVAVGAAERAGAMTRLIDKRKAAMSSTDTPELVTF